MWPLTEEEIACTEDVINALKPLKIAALVMSEQKTSTVSTSAPLHAQLSQGTPWPQHWICILKHLPF